MLHGPVPYKATIYQIYPQKEEYSKQKRCNKCDRRHKKFKCPAFKKKCNRCQESGHFQVRCPQRAQVDEVCTDESDEESYREYESESSSELSECGLLSNVQCGLLTITPNVFQNATEINTIANDWIEEIEFMQSKNVNCKIVDG